MTGIARGFGIGPGLIASMFVALVGLSTAHAQPDAGVASSVGDGPRAFAFAVVGTATGERDRSTPSLLRAIDESDARFVVHFELSMPSAASCTDAAIDRRRALLDASARPVVPVVSASQWAACGKSASDPQERLSRIGDAFFGSDASLGQTRLQWLRQSAVPRFHRTRENVRWQVGGILFVTVNLPDNNNNFRIAAGRNGEFEERLVANRAWIERCFRIASERRLAGVVIFVDASPGFRVPLRAPDPRSRDRDGYYEWKLALREFVPSFKGQVLLVQARGAPAGADAAPAEIDEPLRDASGRPIANLVRVALADGAADLRWLRIDVDPGGRTLFRVESQRLFDDPSGELYGPARTP